MSPDKGKALEEAYQIILATGLNQVPLDGIEELITPDVMGFGTTVDEKIHDLLGFINMVKSQEDQSKEAGLDFSFQPERIHQRISPNKDSALFVEQVIVFLKSEGEIVHQFNLRFSVLMEYLEGHWKMVHWHTSVPVDTENDTWHIDKFRKENEKLEKLVAEQTADLQQKNRELEIEAATQRVRAVAMGMQEPDDIMKVLNVLKEEVDKFELGNIATWIWTKDEDGLITQWDISEVIEKGNLVNFNLRFDIYDEEKNLEVNRHTIEWEKGKKYYALNWRGEKLQAVVDEVAEIDPENGKMFQEAVDVGQIEDYWHTASPFSRGVIGLDFTSTPPEMTESILLKMSSAFDMAYQRFEDLQKAEAQAKESRIEAALERVRSRTMAMQNSNELADVGLILFQQIEQAIGLKPESSWITFIDPDENTMEIWVTHDDKFVKPKRVSASDHENFEQEIAAWKSGEDSIQIAQPKEDFIQVVKKNFGMEVADKKEYSDFHVLNVRHNYGFLGIGAWKQVSDENIKTYQRFAKVFDQTYTRFLDLQKSEQQAYESKVEASLERVRGMAAAMNHSDDLMQIAEAMFKEMEILKINPLRYGLGMIDGEKMEAELWASTVDDGRYLDLLGTLSLTWHPMLQEVFNAWNAQHEEVIYELKGKELSDYYQKIGPINPDIPNLKALQDPKTKITQYVSFFPFKSGALYAFTNGEPGEEGKSILKRFANVFEQAHIRYSDLQITEKQARQIREERDRLSDTLKELRATQEQLVQQEKLASLGQLTAGIAHEIKNPLNFVNNFSELSIELVEEAREEVRRVTEDGEKAKGKSEKETPLLRGESESRKPSGEVRGVSEEAKDVDQTQNSDEDSSFSNTPLPSEASAKGGGGSERSEQGDDSISTKDETTSLLLEILNDIEANLKTIHKHGSRADSIVKSMLQHSRGGDGNMEPTPLNPLIKEYVNLAFHGMRAGKEPINVDIELDLDDSIGEVPLVAEDFSRVILNLVNNGFDAMREKSEKAKGKRQKSPFEGGKDGETVQGDDTASDYNPKLTVRTHQTGKSITIEIEDNGPGIPDEMKDKILQPFFTTKKGTAGTGLGLSITHDIVKAHGGKLNVQTEEGKGTIILITIPKA